VDSAIQVLAQATVKHAQEILIYAPVAKLDGLW